VSVDPRKMIREGKKLVSVTGIKLVVVLVGNGRKTVTVTGISVLMGLTVDVNSVVVEVNVVGT